MTDTRAAPRFVGQAIARKEDLRFLTGRGRFVDDHMLPGMLHAAFVRSPFAHARIVSIDTSAAKALPGVHAVFTAAELHDRTQPLPYIFAAQVSVSPQARCLADGVVRLVGDPVALIVADDRYIAEDAAELVDIDYDPLDAIVTFDDARDGAAIHPHTKSNVAAETQTPADPELDRIFAEAAHVVRKTIQCARAAPSPMETRGIIASMDSMDELTVWLSSQNPHHARGFIAGVTQVPENRIRVISPDVGGGFGQKYFVHRDELAVIEAARLLRRPIKWIEDRAEALIAGGHARTEKLGIELAFNGDARITGARVSVEETCGAYPLNTPEGTAGLITIFFTGPYKIPRTAAQARSWFTHTGGLVAYRGPWCGESLIREAAMDEAARQLGIDPIDLRRRNFITAADQPWTVPFGLQIGGVTPVETTEQAAAMIGWEGFRVEQAEARAQGRHIGIGVSAYIEPCAISMGINSTDIAEVRIDLSGQVTVRTTGHSQGHGIETTLAQVAADELGVDIADVTVLFGDTSAIGYGAGAGGSRQALVNGGAVKQASSSVRQKVLRIAAHLLQSPPDDLRIERGVVVSNDPVPRSISLREIAATAYHNVDALPLDVEPGLEAQHRFRPPPFSYSNATHICTAEVDVTTGMVKVLRWVVSEDCGVMLNPAVVEGQVAGGVVQAMGNVLWEDFQYDADGNPLSGTFKDYLMPLIGDIPVMEFGHLCTPSDTPTGAKGVGEGGAIVGLAAIYNAVADALAPFDVTLEQLPLSPSRILAAIGK